MPLSDDELQALHQLEQALLQDDPRLASRLSGQAEAAALRRTLMLSSLGIVAGIGLLLGGVIVQMPPLGVAGFVLMLFAAYKMLETVNKKQKAPVTRSSMPAPANLAAPDLSSRYRVFLDKMERRWQRRLDERQ